MKTDEHYVVLWLLCMSKNMNLFIYEDKFVALKSFGSFDSIVWTHASLINLICCIGIKLVVELIPNHTSRRHKWFLQSRQSTNNPYSDFYVWDNGRRFENGSRIPPNNWVIKYKGVFNSLSFVYVTLVLQLPLGIRNRIQPVTTIPLILDA